MIDGRAPTRSAPPRTGLGPNRHHLPGPVRSCADAGGSHRPCPGRPTLQPQEVSKCPFLNRSLLVDRDRPAPSPDVRRVPPGGLRGWTDGCAGGGPGRHCPLRGVAMGRAGRRRGSCGRRSSWPWSSPGCAVPHPPGPLSPSTAGWEDSIGFQPLSNLTGREADGNGSARRSRPPPGDGRGCVGREPDSRRLRAGVLRPVRCRDWRRPRLPACWFSLWFRPRPTWRWPGVRPTWT